MNRTFNELVRAKWDENKFLCIGLDPSISKLPSRFAGLSAREALFEFNASVIDATCDVVASYKPNPAFYESEGVDGWLALADTFAYLKSNAPDVPLILDAKRGDIGNTNTHYARMAFDIFGADAITIHPYTGYSSLAPFFERQDKTSFVLVRTSDSGSNFLQDVIIDSEPLYLKLARDLSDNWNKNSNVAIVVGATRPDDIARARAVAPGLPFLIPGVGAQGGDLSASVRAGITQRGQGILINSSRSILYASSGDDFASEARNVSAQINRDIVSAIR